jgi:riboflavin synthase
MFTGIIQETGRIAGMKRKGASMRLGIACRTVLEGAELGDSIAVNGVCLTADALTNESVEMDVGEETFRRTTLGALKIGDAVNLEPALRLGQPLGGHIVSGHVDATAAVKSVVKETTQIVMSIELPEALRPLVAEKGSIAVDGVSLTVGKVEHGVFSLYLIPHTVARTTLLHRAPGSLVNLEADVLARYVANALAAQGGGKGNLSDLLVEFGYSGKGRGA